MEKFKYANAVTNDAFKKIFGLRSTSPEWSTMQSLYIYRRSNLNESEFFKFFHIKDTHFSYLDKFSNNDFTQVFHKEIYYCPECMKLGYHSYLHQFTFSNYCPFHDVQLICLKYKEKAVPYSIDFTLTEAYSVMQAKEKQPSERYIDILPSRKLIDGIWQLTPNYIKIDSPALHKIIFFNPSIEPQESIKPTKYATFKLVDTLIKNKKDINFKPAFYIHTKSSISDYNELLAKSEAWFKSKHQVFNKSSLECWFIAMLVEELLQNIDKDVLRFSISNMQQHQFYYNIDSEDYIKAAAAVITAFIVTNARDLYEGIDNSIVYHYWTHNKVNRSPFSIFDIETYVNSKGVIDRYIPFLVFRRLFGKLHENILKKLQADIEITFNEPDFVITLKDDYFEIYEIYSIAGD